MAASLDLHPEIRVFIGSSSNAESFSRDIARHLGESGYAINFWRDIFDRHPTFLLSLEDLLRSNEFFVLILSKDHQIKASVKSRGKQYIPNDNVVFEAGAAFGKSGLGRLILVCDKDAHVPTDLDGVQVIPFESSDDASKIAKDIDKKIKELRRAQKDNDGRLHWLSLFRCAPQLHDRVIDLFEEREQSDLAKKCDVRYVRYGVLWGKADNFLLFSVPDVHSFTEFGNDMRKHGKDKIRSMDSRLIFPTMHYQHRETAIPEGWVSHLVLLPVAAHDVVTVYEQLHKRAQEQDERACVRISYVGVATGEDDVFFITDAKSTEDHQDYISMSFIAKDFMAGNTSSFAVTNDSAKRRRAVR